MILVITFTFILFIPFAHSCWSSCPSENEKICIDNWISLVKVIDSNRSKVDPIDLRYTLEHLYVFKKNFTFTSWHCKKILRYPESFCNGRMYWPFTLEIRPLALSAEHQLPIFLDASLLTSSHPKLLDVGKTYILSGPRPTDSLRIDACSSITQQVDDISNDALVQKLAIITPEECVTMFDEAEK